MTPLYITVTPDAHAITTGTDLDSVTLNPDPIAKVIGVVATRILIEVTPDHSTDLHVATSHMRKAPAPCFGVLFRSKHDNLSENFHPGAVQFNGAYNWPPPPDL